MMYNVKTNADNYIDFKDTIRYKEFTEEQQNDCMNKLYENNEYIYGNSLDRCFITRNHPFPVSGYLCRELPYKIYHESHVDNYGKNCQDGYGNEWLYVYWFCFLLEIIGIIMVAGGVICSICEMIKVDISISILDDDKKKKHE